VDKVSKQFGDNLRKIRLSKGMSQSQLAEKIGSDKSYISTIEHGKKNLTLETMSKLAQALGVSREELMK